jgi:hypothetical protein
MCSTCYSRHLDAGLACNLDYAACLEICLSKVVVQVCTLGQRLDNHWVTDMCLAESVKVILLKLVL